MKDRLEVSITLESFQHFLVGNLRNLSIYPTGKRSSTVIAYGDSVSVPGSSDDMTHPAVYLANTDWH